MICGRCGQPFTGHPALSRADNSTELCPCCGTAEAIDCLRMRNQSRTEVQDYLLSRLKKEVQESE